ncbi:MAG: hypothetical protein GXO16_02010 [Epsilonproteobacteria bacterium]|nr:hypothetical protein [Campylobacterota bacterium]
MHTALSYSQILFPFLELVIEVENLKELQLLHYIVQRYSIERNILPKDAELPELEIPSDFIEAFFTLLDTFINPQTPQDIEMLHYVFYLFALYRGFLDEEEASADDKALVEEIKKLLVDVEEVIDNLNKNDIDEEESEEGVIVGPKRAVVPTEDFHSWLNGWIESWQDNPEKKEVVEAYEERGIDITKIESIEEFDFYKEYLSYFDVEGIEYVLPEFVDEAFDWDLLFKLIAGSISADWEFVFEGEKPRLKIVTVAGDRRAQKYLDELWGFQIERMFEIFIAEQMSLEKLGWEGEEEIVQTSRQKRVRHFEEQKRRYRRYQLLSNLKGEGNGGGKL